MPQPDNREAILDQFTRQAVPFSTAPGVRDEEALRLLVTASGAGPADSVLDVACGPGLVAAAFARVARHVTGIDLTPAMIDRARALVRERGLVARLDPRQTAGVICHMIDVTDHIGTQAGKSTRSLRCGQRLLQIGDQIIDMLQPDRQADQRRIDLQW